MTTIYLETTIKADINTVFDLSRSIDLHKVSMSHTNEIAIAGKISGFIELNETVTWQAKHLGVTQKLTSKVTQLIKPFVFVDEMVSGAFKSFKHIHYFEEKEASTMLYDVFMYESPLGFLGKIADVLFLKRYMQNLLERRNRDIKCYAEKNKKK